MVSKPNWACSMCGMYSSRKESVRRHINNENIHMGNGTIISYSDSLIARQAGLYVSNPAASGLHNGRIQWVKDDFGADYIISDYTRVPEEVKEITQGKMADVVLNSIGISTWESSFASIGINGRWVTFGGLTGADVKLNVEALYPRQIKLIGSTGGTRKDMQELLDISNDLKIRLWKRFKLEKIKEALQALFAKERDGRVLLELA
jgi:NADPH:quinone reductase-like Zn-dependent oxidoreductase